MRSGVGVPAWREPFDRFDMLIDEFGVEVNTVVGVNSSFADLVDLGLSERLALILLCRERNCEQQRSKDERQETRADHGFHLQRQPLKHICWMGGAETR